MKFRLYPHEPSPKVLEARDLQSLVKYMKSDSCQNVFLMVITPLLFLFHGINAGLCS